MNIPANLKYTNDDEWIRLEGEEAYVGITDYAQHELRRRRSLRRHHRLRTTRTWRHHLR